MVIRKNHRCAFTLTEVAIVLGIVGMVLGAIWVAYAKVSDNRKIQQAVSETTTIIAGMRAKYNNRAAFDSGDLTGMAINAGIIPSDAVVNGVAHNPWNTTSAAYVANGQGITVAANTGWAIQCNSLKSVNTLEIVFWGVPQGACAGLMKSFIGQAATSDLICLYSDQTGAFTTPATTTVSQVAKCSGNVVIYYNK